jgi:RHS repeat-associated protein
VQSPSGGVLEELTSGGTAAARYPLPDALGSVRGLANASGSLAGSSDYDALGSVCATSGSSSIFGFTGQQTDATSRIYLRAPYYNPILGRFVSPDSLFPNSPGTQGYSMYGYVANDPTTLIDPGGHEIAFYARWLAVVGAEVHCLALGCGLAA